MGARYYSPSLGQFISPDPLPLATGQGDLNVYAYVRGQSYRAVDPTGLDGVDLFSDVDSGLRAAQHAITKKATSGGGPTASKAESWVGGQSSQEGAELTERVEGARFRTDAVAVFKNHVVKGGVHAAAANAFPFGVGSVLYSGAQLIGAPSANQIADKLTPVSPSASPESHVAGGFMMAGVGVGVALASAGVAVGAEALAAGGAGELVHGGGQVLRHYTNAEGFAAIMESGMLRAPASGPMAGRVFATELEASPQVVAETLFGSFETHAGRGSHVIELVTRQGVSFEFGKPGELIHQGTLRFGR